LETEKVILAGTPGAGNLSGKTREASEVVYVMALDLRANAIDVVAEADLFKNGEEAQPLPHFKGEKNAKIHFTDSFYGFFKLSLVG
jgi:transposase-like protein